jgi:hypothetical protein
VPAFAKIRGTSSNKCSKLNNAAKLPVITLEASLFMVPGYRICVRSQYLKKRLRYFYCCPLIFLIGYQYIYLAIMTCQLHIVR